MADTAYPVRQYIAASVSQKLFREMADEKAMDPVPERQEARQPYALAGSKELYKDKSMPALVAGGRTDPFTARRCGGIRFLNGTLRRRTRAGEII